MITLKLKKEFAKTLFREISDILEYDYNKEHQIKQKRQRIKADNVESFLIELAKALLENDDTLII